MHVFLVLLLYSPLYSDVGIESTIRVISSA